MEAQREISNHANALWLIDPTHTTVEFSVKNLFFFTVKGRLTELAGTIVLDENDIRRSSVQAAIKSASIETGHRKRDAHLRAADFLDAERHPEIHFQSTKVEPGRDRDTLRITGPLTIKGRTKEVVLDVTEVDRSRSPNGQEVAYYAALTEINRFDFEVNYGRMMVGRKVKIAINVQALRQH
jgi:polyisoprenoid-binding protein YceI